MRKFIALTALTMGLTTATTADAGAGRWGHDLRFVADTTMPGARTTSLCHLVDTMDIFRVPVYTIQKGYALSSDGCTSGTYREVATDQFIQLQTAGLIPADLPAVPTPTLMERLWGHAWLVFGGLALLAKTIAALGKRRRSRGGDSDPLVLHALVAMSQVAVADGKIEDGEVRQISHILTRLTGTSYSPEQVSQMLATLNPQPSDLDQVGLDLSAKDCQIVLEAALNIAVADGEIHAAEYAIVSELAQRMRIGADQFRSALARIAAHLQTVQPA